MHVLIYKEHKQENDFFLCLGFERRTLHVLCIILTN